MADDGRREEDERAPGAVYRGFVVMETLMEKLKVLDVEEEVLSKHNMKNLPRHNFVSSPYVASNPGEQFYMFSIIAAWLINAAGRPFAVPQETDEPNATVANILTELRAMGVKVDFPPSKLKSGSGEFVCLVLDRLADEALRKRGFSFRRPKYPPVTAEDEPVSEAMVENGELMLGVQEEEEENLEEPEEEVETVLDLEDLKLRSGQSEVGLSSKPEEILHATVDAAEWMLELERVLPQLKVTVRSDNKDWRIHVDQMHQHRDGITLVLQEATGHLDRLQEDIGKTLEKVSSREKYINNQLETLVQEYRSAKAKLSQVKVRHLQASKNVAEKTRILAEVSDELEKVKVAMEERGSSMSDGAPVVRVKQSLTKLKQEVFQMDVRVGVVQHTLLQAKLREKSNMTRDMHAASHVSEASGSTRPFS
ncbi:intraflagellar transport protein 57 homolog [Synchiropus picturatus]